jgi:ferritin-like protein
VNYKQAYQSFVYHGERIYGPLGEESPYHEEMRNKWAFVIDKKLYRYLPNDPVEADNILHALWWGELSDVKLFKEILKKIKKAPLERRISLQSIGNLIDEIIGR